jgi:hypothetical protein
MNHQQMTRAEIAEDYTSRGFHILPTAAQSKAPLSGSHGFKDAFNDYEIAKITWTDHPEYNIAISTGKVSNITVIDIDYRNGGRESWDTIQDLLPQDTMTVKTPGGMHLYYNYNPGLETWTPLPGIDILNDKHIVIAPGSTVTDEGKGYNNTPYILQNDVPLKTVASIPDVLKKPDKKLQDQINPQGLEQMLQGVDEGERDVVLTKLIGQLSHLKINQEMRKLLAYYYADQCRPALEYSVVDEKLDRLAESWDFQDEELPPDPEIVLPLEHSTVFLNKEIKPEVPIVPGMFYSNTLNIIGGYAKVGKSTLMRQLAVDVAQGKPFLGRDTVQSPVMYLALEESSNRVYAHFKTLGLKDGDPLYLMTDRIRHSYQDVHNALWHQVVKNNIKLLMVDTFSRMPTITGHTLQVSDYGEMSKMLDDLLPIAHELDVCVMLIYHQSQWGKSASKGNTIASLLGSTAIPATADQVYTIMKASDGLEENDNEQRVFKSEGRVQDLPRTLLGFNETTLRSVDLGEVSKFKDESFRETVWDAMTKLWEDSGKVPISQKVLVDNLSGGNDRKHAALKWFVNEGYISRETRVKNSQWITLLSDYFQSSSPPTPTKEDSRTTKQYPLGHEGTALVITDVIT